MISGNEKIALTITVPMGKANVARLLKILDDNAERIKKEAGVDSLPVKVDGDSVSFPWFKELPDGDKVAADIQLISDLCRISLEEEVEEHEISE